MYDNYEYVRDDMMILADMYADQRAILEESCWNVLDQMEDERNHYTYLIPDDAPVDDECPWEEVW